MRRYEISDQAWHRISGLLPGKSTDVGRTARDNRQFLNAVLWIARSGAPWRDLPERFGPWNSVYQRFRRWARKGVWQQVFEELQEPDLDWLLLDSTTIRAHQQAAGQKNNGSGRSFRPQPWRLQHQGTCLLRCPRQPPQAFPLRGAAVRPPAGRGFTGRRQTRSSSG